MGRKIDTSAPRNWQHNQLVAIKPQDKRFDLRSDRFAGLKMRTYPGGRKVWIVDYRFAGKRQTLTIGPFPQFSHAAAAEAATKAFAADPNPAGAKAEKKATAKREAEKAKSGTVRAFLEGDYKKLVLDHRRSGAGTEGRIKQVFEKFLDTHMDQLDWHAVEELFAERRSKGVVATTLNRDRAALTGLLNNAVHRGLIDSNPLARLRPLKVEGDRRVRWLGQRDQHEQIKVDGVVLGERERFERALADPATPALLRDIARLAMNTGLRRGELFSLEWPDIDLERAQLIVRAASAKSAKTRHVPLNPAALELLKRRHAARDKRKRPAWVFPSPIDGKRLRDIKKAWSSLVERAQLTDFRFHDTRHDFASRLVQAGVDLNTVRELLGHGSMEMTLRYAHLAPEHKASAVALLA